MWNLKNVIEHIGEVEEKILRAIWEIGKSIAVREISGKNGPKTTSCKYASFRP